MRTILKPSMHSDSISISRVLAEFKQKSMLFTNTILLLVFLSTVRATPSCNVGLILNDSTIDVINPVPTSIPVLGSKHYWELVGDYGIVKLRFPSTYFTGLGIQVNTREAPPCNFVESSIDLRDYELILDEKRVHIPIRNSNGQSNSTFLRVAFPPVRASSVEIVKVAPIENLPRYCIQYQLYGCATSPTDCDTLLSYDLTRPNVEDSTYTGTCKDGWCSGGVGILHDGEYDKSLSWNGSAAEFRLAFYQSVGVKDVTIFFSPLTDPVTSTPMFNQMNTNEITLQINKVIDSFSFKLNSAGRISVLEIAVNYWLNQKNRITIPCGVSKCSAVSLSSAQVAIPLSTLFVGLVIGIVSTLIILILLRNKKFKLPIIKKHVKPLDTTHEKKKNDYSVHQYTDVHSGTSVTEVKEPGIVSLDQLGRSELKTDRYISVDSVKNSTTEDDAINRENSIYGKGQTMLSSKPTLQKFESEIEYQDNTKYDSFAKKQKFPIDSVLESNEDLDDYSHLKH